MNVTNKFDFPKQKVSASEKNKPEWYTNSIDWVIQMGMNCNDKVRLENDINILHGNIPNSFYRKTLNPYNSNNEKYKRFPATMRNLDMINGIVRRYVSEYYKGIHEFMASANNPDIVLNKEAELRRQISVMAQQQFALEFQKQYQAAIQEAIANGQNPDEVNPQESMPDIEEFIKNFEQQYIDDETKQAQDILEFIRSTTKDELLYIEAYFNFVAFGECYSYTEVRGNEIIKENIPILEAFPVPNNQFFVEDHDMFARRMQLSYNQIIDMFNDTLTKKDRAYLDKYYNLDTAKGGKVTMLNYTGFFEYYPEICCKLTGEEREYFKNNNINIHDVNNGLYEVWHVVWKGQVKRGILTYINEVGFESTMVVDEDFEFNPELGHLNIEWHWENQIYEGYRIGTRYSGIYPIKARALPYERNNKLPYNGIMEVLPNFGKFSIIEIVTPYQVFRNIISYHQEMVIAKNKMLILVMAKSLLGNNPEDTVYKLAADGVLLYDDEEDTNGLKAQQIRLLNANLNQYISELSNLKDSIKYEAWEAVDMTPQRFGEIAASAGKGTTEEAINRGSMGSVILTFVFDEFRRCDYQRDIDYAKLAYIEGLNTSFLDVTGAKRYISLDVNSFITSDLGVTVRNDAKEREKFQQLKEWAFSAAQNGDLDMAFAAITAENITTAKAVIERFMEIKRKHENDLQQAEQMMKQEEFQNKLQAIMQQGEEDRKTQELKYLYEMQLRYIDVDLNLLHHTGDEGEKNEIARELNASKSRLDEMKMQIEREKLASDNYNAAAERNVKREQMKNDLKIARTNKNKYDK